MVTIRPTVIDCFCGAGGLSLGFKTTGFDIKYAFDFDAACVETYRANHGSYAFVRDIKEVTKKSIEETIGALEGVDVVIGGPPCQGFSVQRRGDNDDPRNHLVLEYVRLMLEIRPKFFVMENVGGLLSPRGHYFLEQLKTNCSQAYHIQIKKLDAYDYGVPQHRKRVFIVGERVDGERPKFTFPDGTRNKVASPKTVREAIRDLMHKTEKDVPNHKSDKLSDINLQRIRSIKEGEGRDSLPDHLQLPCHINNSSHRHLDVYGRMAWDKPAPTITARFDSFSRGRFGHPELDRSITLREGARLQTYPDDYVFIGTKVQVAKQIGNAVPPLMAKAIAERIMECLEGRT